MKHKSMKRMMAMGMAVVMALSTGLVGCSSDKKTEDSGNETASEGESGEKVKLRMVTYLGSTERDALVKKIASEVPNVELEIISPPSDQAQQKISSMLQAGEGIDIVELDSVPVENISNGYVECLDDYIKEWPEWETVSEFLKDQLTSYDGKVYSIPYGVYERALFYRTDWFEEKGLEVPKTWEELYETAVTLTDPEQNRYGYSFRGGSGTTGFLQMTILSHMPKDLIDITTPFITKESKSMYEYPEAVQAIEYYKKLYEDGSHPDSIAWGYNEMVEAFYSGVTGMLIQDPEVVATCEKYMEEGTWDVAPLPVGPEGRVLFPAGFAGWGIASSSEHKDEAWEVIKALSSVEGNTYFCKENGNIPIHTTAQEDPFFGEGYYACYMEMAKEPEKYVGYVDGGENRFATKEQVEMISEAGGVSDGIIQSMLMGQISAQECADEIGKYYSWAPTADWVLERNGK